MLSHDHYVVLYVSCDYHVRCVTSRSEKSEPSKSSVTVVNADRDDIIAIMNISHDNNKVWHLPSWGSILVSPLPIVGIDCAVINLGCVGGPIGGALASDNVNVSLSSLS